MKRALVAAALLAVAACGGAEASVNARSGRDPSSDPAVAESHKGAADPETHVSSPSDTTPPTSIPLSGNQNAAPSNGAPPPMSQPAGMSSAAPAITAPAAAKPPDRIGARHILVQWMGTERASAAVVRTREEARVVAEEVLVRARRGEDFARLALEYSDEPGAASRGGSLGRFGKGQMVPAFEAAAFKLKPGEISDIIETPFGFHIIQRTE